MRNWIFWFILNPMTTTPVDCDSCFFFFLRIFRAVRKQSAVANFINNKANAKSNIKNTWVNKIKKTVWVTTLCKFINAASRRIEGVRRAFELAQRPKVNGCVCANTQATTQQQQNDRTVDQINESKQRVGRRSHSTIKRERDCELALCVRSTRVSAESATLHLSVSKSLSLWVAAFCLCLPCSGDLCSSMNVM